MKCDFCGKAVATVHVTEVLNEEMRTLHLCDPCARSQGVHVENPMGFAQLLAALADLDKRLKAAGARPPACPRCGMRFEDFRRSGKLGCGGCYGAFRRQVRPLLKQIHGASRHVGRAPAIRRSAVKLRADLEAVRARFEQAVRAEAFEEAARLRDKMRAMERRLKQGGA